MGLSVMEIEPQQITAYLFVLLVGCIGYLVVRRWPRAILIVLPIAAWFAWYLVGGSVIGLGLPLPGLRQTRARPAI